MQKINADNISRIETGPLQINDDWPGTFIRGDNSFHYAMQLHNTIEYLEGRTEHLDIFALSSLKSLVDTLHSSVKISELDELDDEDEGVGC